MLLILNMNLGLLVHLARPFFVLLRGRAAGGRYTRDLAGWLTGSYVCDAVTESDERGRLPCTRGPRFVIAFG